MEVIVVDALGRLADPLGGSVAPSFTLGVAVAFTIVAIVAATGELRVRRSSHVAAMKQKFHVPFTLGT